MAPRSDYPSVFQRYADAESKFDYFLVGTTLAILAFSIQSTRHVEIVYLRWLIVGSWSSFLLSFLSGLLRLETMVIQRKRELVKQMDELTEDEEWYRIGERIQSKFLWAYRIQKVLLLIGLTSYALFHILNFFVTPSGNGEAHVDILWTLMF